MTPFFSVRLVPFHAQFSDRYDMGRAQAALDGAPLTHKEREAGAP